MNTPGPNGPDRADGSALFDVSVRTVHAQSLAALSPRVQAQLARRRREALAPRTTAGLRRPWAWASAAATAGVLAIALQVRPPLQAPDNAEPVTVALAPAPNGAPDPAGVLAEDPDLYLWLASSESQALALE